MKIYVEKSQVDDFNEESINKSWYLSLWIHCLELEDDSDVHRLQLGWSVCHHSWSWHILFLCDRYHLQCKGQPLADTNDLALCICHYCHFLDSGKLTQIGSGPLVLILYLRRLSIRLRLMVLLSSCLMQIFGGKRAELNKLVELLSDAGDFSVW